MNIGMHGFFWIGVSEFLRYSPSSGIARFSFWGNSILFSTVASPVCIPINCVLGFPFLHNLASTCCLLICLLWPFWLVWSSISLWCQFASFPWLVMLSILSYVYRPSVLLGEVSVQVLGLFFNFIFLVLSCMSSLYILDVKPLSEVSLENMFSHIFGSVLFWWCFL